MVVVVSPETSLSATSRRSNAAPCLGLTGVWVLLTCGPPLSAPLGALDRVHLVARPDLKFDFLIYFHRFECKLQKFIS